MHNPYLLEELYENDNIGDSNQAFSHDSLKANLEKIQADLINFKDWRTSCETEKSSKKIGEKNWFEFEAEHWWHWKWVEMDKLDERLWKGLRRCSRELFEVC